MLGTWMFGAWEMWWFYPFFAVVLAGALFFSARLVARGLSESGEDDPIDPEGISNDRMLWGLVVSSLIFLAYAFVRFRQVEVFMNAERAFLVFFSSFLIAAQVVFGFSRNQLRILFWIVFWNLALLGVYGIVNHAITGSRLVLWAEGFDQYVSEHRATGSYYCPDHFSGLMEILLCLSIGILLASSTSAGAKWLGALTSLMAVSAVALSKSRGGGLTVLVIVATVFVAGFGRWPPLKRWLLRVSFFCGAAIAITILLRGPGEAYMDRFQRYFAWEQTRNQPLNERVEKAISSFKGASRWIMWSGAYRAWKTEPVFGIGPGMHQHLWPRFAASDDGDRELGVFPSVRGMETHSYYVHNDWLQLLQEYGIVGFVLFLGPFGFGMIVLITGMRRDLRDRQIDDWRPGSGRDYYAETIGALLAVAAMSFHSIGDFNLQIPATAWLFAAVVSIPMARILRTG